MRADGNRYDESSRVAAAVQGNVKCPSCHAPIVALSAAFGVVDSSMVDPWCCADSAGRHEGVIGLVDLVFDERLLFSAQFGKA